MERLRSALEETFAAGFIAYYKAHVSHVNITGKDFYQYHKLLQKIYTYLGDNIDTVAEKLRTIKALMPRDLNTVLELSPIPDVPVVGGAEDMLREVLDSIKEMIDQWHLVNDAAEQVNYIDISNFAQDQIGQLAGFKWMLEATLDDEPDADSDD